MGEDVSDGADPYSSVTREQLVTMLWRYAGEPASDIELTFSDNDQISSWAQEAMRWAVETGLIEGRENNMAAPGDTATRAEVAAIMMRYLED